MGFIIILKALILVKRLRVFCYKSVDECRDNKRNASVVCLAGLRERLKREAIRTFITMWRL